MLTFNLRHGVAAALFVLALSAHTPARADWTLSTSCAGTFGNRACVSNFRLFPRDTHVRHVPVDYDMSERERQDAIARDRKWLAFCKPVVVKDRYGVERYLYDRPGCEFGRAE